MWATKHGIIRLTKREDINNLNLIARPEDRREVEDISGYSLYKNLSFALGTAKPCLTARTHQGMLLGIFGVVPTSIREGTIAMVGTQAIEDNKLTFLRGSLDVLRYLQCGYNRLYNVVDCRNELHIDYLKWLGFKMLRRIEQFGAAKIPVIEFERRVR